MHIGLHKLFPLILSISIFTGCEKSVTDYVSELKANASDFVSDMVSEASDTASNYLSEAAKSTPHHYAVEIFNKVFEFVQAKNCQAIYDMFCEYDKENDADLMLKIEQLVKFMDGEVVEIGHISASSNYSTVRDGVTESAAYTADSIIETNGGVKYWFKVGVVTTDKDETKIGLDWIYILDSSAKTAFVNEWVDWKENDGSKKTEPQQPENMEIWVIYRP